MLLLNCSEKCVVILRILTAQYYCYWCFLVWTPTVSSSDLLSVCMLDFILCQTAVKSKRKKFSHTCYRALGPELIPVYRQSAHRLPEVNHAIDLVVGCHYFLPGLRLPPQLSPDGATCKRQHTSDPALLLIYRPRKDERLSWPSWLTCSGWFTSISGHPSAAGRAQDRESSPVRDRRSTTVLRHQLCPTSQKIVSTVIPVSVTVTDYCRVICCSLLRRLRMLICRHHRCLKLPQSQRKRQ